MAPAQNSVPGFPFGFSLWVPKALTLAVVLFLAGGFTRSVNALERVEPAGEWVLVKDKNGVLVEQRAVVGSKLKETSGSLVIAATVEALAAVLADSEACPEWMHGCKIGRSVALINLGERVNYSVIDAPYWYDDRDAYVRSSIRYTPDIGVLRVDLKGDADYAPLEKGRVRVLDLFASWTFEPVGDSHVEATYQMYNDPQIGVPKSVNKNLVKTVYNTLRNLQKIVQKPEYANAKFGAELEAAISE